MPGVKKTHKKKRLIVVLLVIAVAIGVSAVSIWAYKTITVNQLRSIAYEFKPQSNWVKIYEYSIDPEIVMCLADNPCPKYEISWNDPDRITKEQLANMMVSAGWDPALEGDCTLRRYSVGAHGVCQTSFKKYGKTIGLYYEQDSLDTNYNRITIRVYE